MNPSGSVRPNKAIPDAVAASWSLLFVSNCPHADFTVEDTWALIATSPLPLPIALRPMAKKQQKTCGGGSSWIAAYRTATDADSAMAALRRTRVGKVGLFSVSNKVTGAKATTDWTSEQTSEVYRLSLAAQPSPAPSPAPSFHPAPLPAPPTPPAPFTRARSSSFPRDEATPP